MTWKRVCVIIAVFGVTYAKNVPIVNTKLGQIRGQQADDGDYSMYLGIPYADIDENKPFGGYFPVYHTYSGPRAHTFVKHLLSASLTIKDSTPHPSFESIFDANNDSVHCPQQNEFTKKIEGGFGCLHLNVYVPNNIKPNKTLPILVWIYGGGFIQGFSDRYLYGPKFLMKHDIIFITFNYRLGPYGFLCLDTPEAPGNQGVKDQVLAFRWIRNNIEAFGGDAGRITAMGESVGATFIEVHILSKNENLFNAAIIHSGSVYASDMISTVESNKKSAFELSEKLGFKSNDSNEIVSFFTKLNPKKLVEAFFELNSQYPMCVEKSFENVTSILSEHPDYLTIPKDKIIPILGGFNSRENLVSYTDHRDMFLKKSFFRDYLEYLFHVNDEMVDIVHRYYIGDEEISEAVKDNLIDFSSDFRRNYSSQKSLLGYKRQGALVYQYMFSYSGTRNFVKNRFNITDVGAAHADELSYIFDLSYDKHATQEDQLIIDRTTTLWTNFAQYGNPTPEVTELIPVKWIPMSDNKVFYFDINVELSMKTRPFHSRMAFWDLFFKTYEKKKLSYKDYK